MGIIYYNDFMTIEVFSLQTNLIFLMMEILFWFVLEYKVKIIYFKKTLDLKKNTY